MLGVPVGRMAVACLERPSSGWLGLLLVLTALLAGPGGSSSYYCYELKWRPAAAPELRASTKNSQHRVTSRVAIAGVAATAVRDSLQLLAS